MLVGVFAQELYDVEIQVLRLTDADDSTASISWTMYLSDNGAVDDGLYVSCNSDSCFNDTIQDVPLVDGYDYVFAYYTNLEDIGDSELTIRFNVFQDDHILASRDAT